MENFSRSLSKKVSNGNGNGNGFAAKTVYDDVFGGPPKFGVPTFSPRIEDYSEIFGGFHASRASSIPVLDLPVLDEAEVSFDVQSSKFDYLDVFGGFNGFDFAVSYEELFDQSKGEDESSEEAWTLAETESLWEEMDPSVYSGKNQSLSNGDCPQSFDGIKQFNVPYHKANQRSQEDMSNGTHMTQLHDAPGFTFAVDGITSLLEAEYENLPLQVTDDINLSMDFSEGKIRGKHLRKTKSHPSNTGAGIHSFGKDIKPQRGYDQNGSHRNEMFISVSEIGLRTQPSQLPPPARPPPVVDVRKGDSSGLALNLKATRNHTFEGTAGDSSPPFFDVEVDASSSAAASAAAMKEAVEKAQAKLKSAKELMVRRKEGLQSRVKLGSKNDVKDRETKGGKVVDGSDNLKDERLKGTCERVDDGMKFFVGQERQTVGKISQGVSDSSTEGDNSFNVAKSSAEKKHGKGSWSSQESCKTEGAGEWKEATEFFELVSTDKSRKALQQANSEKILVQNSKTQEHGQKERKAIVEAFEQQEENDKKMKAATEAREKKENEKKSKAAKEARRIEECEKKVSVAQEVRKQEVDEKKLRVAHDLEVSENKLTEADEREEDEILIEVKQKENEVAVKESMKHKETEQKLKDANERMANKKRLTEAHKREENEQRLKETLEREEYEKILKDALERAENEKRLKQALKKEENEKRLKEVLEQEEVEKKQKEACEREENEKRLKEAREREENKKRLKEALEREDNEKKQREAREREENERKLRDAREREENERKLREVRGREENERKLREAREREENEKKLREALQQEENEKRLKEALEKEENEKKQKVAHESVENEKRLREACEREEVEKRLKEACEREENKKRLEEAHEREENENRIKEVVDWEEIEEEIKEETEERSRQSSKWEECENSSKFAGEGEKRGLHKACEETVRDENEKKQKLAQGTYAHIEGENLKAPDEVCKLNENKNFRATQVACKHEENSVKLETTQEVLAEKNEKIRARPRQSEKEVEAVEKANVLVGDRSKASFSLAQGDLQLEEVQIRIEEAIKSLHFGENVQKSGEAVFGIGQTRAEKNIEVSQMAFDPKNMEKKLTHEWGERGKNIKHTQVAFDQEENMDKFMSTQVVNEGERKMETAQLAMSEAKGNTQKIAHQVNTSQRAERKEKNLSETLTLEEREKEERMKRERELEKDRLRKLEEEREREREREKDRMAVERATRDARERAYADAARERAERAAVERAERAAVERATAEFRQRALAEARERLEKACAEAREKTLTEKASTEARLRAERAAVERATAEARERAFEKAMAEKPGFEARERVERSASSSVSRFPYSVYGASYNTEKFEGVEGESAQRCKARLERYRRTAERAAKALAEKNMRDLQAQREQSERNRLSESLDADVKRWSSGKEGNLRALLSTLQYILGSDSGWQPIPLTDVITAAAVKKAYRKATLCVHPDKLQQRGASIQQKYICEKVFDLLKEAWNKFNSEER